MCYIFVTHTLEVQNLLKKKLPKKNKTTRCSYKSQKSGGRVVWIGFWSCAPPHPSHSFASRERFQVSESHIHLWRIIYASKLLLLRLFTLTHIFCSLAHPYQVIPCKGNDWLLSQTFPEVIGGVTSTRHVTSTISFLPRKCCRRTRKLNTMACPLEVCITVCII